MYAFCLDPPMNETSAKNHKKESVTSGLNIFYISEKWTKKDFIANICICSSRMFLFAYLFSLIIRIFKKCFFFTQIQQLATRWKFQGNLTYWLISDRMQHPFLSSWRTWKPIWLIVRHSFAWLPFCVLRVLPLPPSSAVLLSIDPSVQSMAYRITQSDQLGQSANTICMGIYLQGGNVEPGRTVLQPNTALTSTYSLFFRLG